MYEKANYFGNKFIRNGIAGILFTAFIFYYTFVKDKPFNPVFIAFPIAAIVWLYFGIKIKRKLKLKDSSKQITEITDERISVKQVERILFILILATIYLGIYQWHYASYFTLIILLIYTSWFTLQMKALNEYFKS